MVYEPSEDSFLLLKYAAKYSKGKVLDIGAGSGILAAAAAAKAESVTAADIDEKAVERCKKRVKGRKINVIRSDLFSNIRGKFDLIIFNPPYLPDDKQVSDRALHGGKNGHEILERFLSEAVNHLESDGKILIVFSSITGKSRVDAIIRRNNLRFKELEKARIFFEDLYCYIITR